MKTSSRPKFELIPPLTKEQEVALMNKFIPKDSMVYRCEMKIKEIKEKYPDIYEKILSVKKKHGIEGRTCYCIITI